MLLRFSAPLATNARMEDFLERGLFLRVLKDYGPKSPPIQVAGGRINGGSEFRRQLLAYIWILIDKFACGLVGIKKRRGRNDFPHAIAKRRFAGGDPTRDPDSRHLGSYD